MKIKTKYFAFMREKLGRDSEEFELNEGATVQDFIEVFKAKYAEKLSGLFEAGSLKTGFALALNDENLDRLRWRQTRLQEGDVVVILPPIAGGFI
ncbi:MAG: MoaD family protein [Candidatus Caldarchaeum sp.]